MNDNLIMEQLTDLYGDQLTETRKLNDWSLQMNIEPYKNGKGGFSPAERNWVRHIANVWLDYWNTEVPEGQKEKLSSDTYDLGNWTTIMSKFQNYAVPKLLDNSIVKGHLRSNPSHERQVKAALRKVGTHAGYALWAKNPELLDRYLSNIEAKPKPKRNPMKPKMIPRPDITHTSGADPASLEDDLQGDPVEIAEKEPPTEFEMWEGQNGSSARLKFLEIFNTGKVGFEDENGNKFTADYYDLSEKSKDRIAEISQDTSPEGGPLTRAEIEAAIERNKAPKQNPVQPALPNPVSAPVDTKPVKSRPRNLERALDFSAPPLKGLNQRDVILANEIRAIYNKAAKKGKVLSQTKIYGILLRQHHGTVGRWIKDFVDNITPWVDSDAYQEKHNTRHKLRMSIEDIYDRLIRGEYIDTDPWMDESNGPDVDLTLLAENFDDYV